MTKLSHEEEIIGLLERMDNRLAKLVDLMETIGIMVSTERSDTRDDRAEMKQDRAEIKRKRDA